MVKIVENWSHVIGRVEGWQPPSAPGEPGTLIVRLDRAEKVKDQSDRVLPNFLEGVQGQVLQVAVPAAAASGLQPTVGANVELDVRRGRQPSKWFARAEGIKIWPQATGLGPQQIARKT